MTFRLKKTIKVSQVTESGCSLGVETREMDLFFRVEGVSIMASGCWARLHAGISDSAMQFYGEYPVTINTNSDEEVLNQAQHQIMNREEFSEAIKVI
ncbi:hypothetical protein [Klebsiella pneumoniae]|uniref:hypothetical protein n=1 Tax=Klebsiella pneumoniae TaxID=573 RepID=UPI001090E609|nr:hypothetical protein [Klebsiella pneumoniae]VGH76614.1 Uncharacterised protein [Klebsiella pneumoniae]